MSASPSAPPIPDDWLAAGVVARHETFCPRYGGLKKAVDRLSGTAGRAPEPEVFVVAAGFTKFQGHRQIQFLKPPAQLSLPGLETGYSGGHAL